MPEKKELKLLTPKYCEHIYQTRRRPTRTINVSLEPVPSARLSGKLKLKLMLPLFQGLSREEREVIARRNDP
jgi:hypothetical protein